MTEAHKTHQRHASIGQNHDGIAPCSHVVHPYDAGPGVVRGAAGYQGCGTHVVHGHHADALTDGVYHLNMGRGYSRAVAGCNDLLRRGGVGGE
jgi:hypothetical protein